MRIFSITFISVFLCFCLETHAQLPSSVDPSITVSEIMQVKAYAVRIAKNPVNNSLYYATYTGNIYKINQAGTTFTDTLIATANEHHVNYLQGMLFKNNMLYLVGNRKMPNTAGHGLVMGGLFQGNGTWLWDTIMYTAPYPSTATLFDHAFAGICLSNGGDSLFISSGSRTDHGETQTTGGLFPGAREAPLTSKIYRIPVNPSNTIFLPNDSTMLNAGPYIYSYGVRNTFDMALAPNGDLFGTENSGDRDDPEELNVILKNGHYGFPWRMGGNATGMQFPAYNQNNDKLINHNCLAWTSGYFYNDPSYPQPGNIVFREPVQNYGPDADKFKDPVNGSVRDASNEGIAISSFTSHRSPLGLIFDNSGVLAPPYRYSAFMLSYTEGTADTTGTTSGGSIGPFSDIGQDLLQLSLYKNTSGQYSMNCYRTVWNFKNPVDAFLSNNVLYVIESHYPNNPVPAKLYAVTFPSWNSATAAILPKDSTICSGSSLAIIPKVKGQNTFMWSTGATTAHITVAPTVNTTYWVKVNNGIALQTDTMIVSVAPVPTTPTSISVSGGAAKVCPGDTRIYTTGLTQNVTYDWDVPTGAVINSGQGTRSINVTYNSGFTANGVITVIKTSGCGSSNARTINITRNVPSTPSVITGPNYGLCGLTNQQYSVSNISGLTYNWTVPAGVTIVNGQGTNTIKINFPSTNVTGTIAVRGVNACGQGNGRNLTVRTIPAQPLSITGAINVCPNAQDIPYSVSPLAGASTYTWTGPSGSRITANGITSPSNVLTTTSTSITVDFANVTASSTLKVRGNNTCGSGSVRTIKLQPCGFRVEETAEKELSILTNPVSELLVLSNAHANIEIYNTLGELVIKINNESCNAACEIDVSVLNPGIYIVRSENKTARFVKQ
ncbi:MAG: PQQ-dependent sugar dehydrogenase [Bacteroidota bacterium]